MRSSRAGVLLLAAIVMIPTVRMTAQYDHTRALAPLPVTEVSCRNVPVNVKARSKTELARTVTLLGKNPERILMVRLDTANRVLNFSSLISWFYPARGFEGVDLWFASDGRILRSSRTTRADGAKASVKTSLTAGDLEIANKMVRDVLNRCRG